ncbi:NusA N-terminal domain-containing protein [Mycoplasma sp. 6243]|uniref:NusA N-terminal domain-containing protein n=1 Tax=Mycoplasma sp. 6243 TaxID=3440865 RepID=UPI003EBA833B
MAENKNIVIDKRINEKNQLYQMIYSYAESKNFDFDTILNIFKEETLKVITKDIDPDAEIDFIVNHEDKTITLIKHNIIVVDDSDEIVFEEINEKNSEPDLQRLLFIHIKEAKILNPNIHSGDTVDIIWDFGWISKKHRAAIENGFRSELKFVDKERISNIFANKIGQKFHAKVLSTMVRGGFLVEILEDNRLYKAYLSKHKLNRSEPIHPGSDIQVTLEGINLENNLNVLEVSMIDPNQVQETLKTQISEIGSGDIEIVKVQRIPGIRSKVAVRVNPNRNFNYDIVGSIFGEGAKRIIAVSDIIKEKIDIIRWSANKLEYVKNALSPAKVIDVVLHKKTQKAYAVVEKEEFKKAIGRSALNIDLASKLTETKIEVVDVEKAMQLKIPFKLKEVKKTFFPREKSLFNTNKKLRKSKPNQYLKDINISMDDFDKDVADFYSSMRMQTSDSLIAKQNTSETIDSQQKNKLQKTNDKIKQSSESMFDDLFEKVDNQIQSDSELNNYDFVDDINSSFDINFAAEEEIEEFQNSMQSSDKPKEFNNKNQIKKEKKVITEYKKIKDFKVDNDLMNYGLDTDINFDDFDDEWES